MLAAARGGPPKSMKDRPLLRALRSALATGAVVYGSAISLAHVAHNRLGSVRDALVLWIWCALLYGLGLAAATLVGAIPAWLARRRAIDPARSRTADPRWWGLLFFHLGFWELFFLHGLTYDHYPFGTLHSVWGMLAFLVGCALLIAVGVW